MWHGSSGSGFGDCIKEEWEWTGWPGPNFLHPRDEQKHCSFCIHKSSLTVKAWLWLGQRRGHPDINPLAGGHCRFIEGWDDSGTGSFFFLLCFPNFHWNGIRSFRYVPGLNTGQLSLLCWNTSLVLWSEKLTIANVLNLHQILAILAVFVGLDINNLYMGRRSSESLWRMNMMKNITCEFQLPYWQGQTLIPF